LIAAQEEWLGSLQIGWRLYPDFQVAGSRMANLTYVARKPLLQRYRGGIYSRPDLDIADMQLHARKVLQAPERDVMLQFFHLDIVPERQKEGFQRFP
jgi:hypothetical protein